MAICIKTRTHVICPHCEEVDKNTVDHIIEDEINWFGPWYCVHCRKSYSGTYKNGTIKIEKCDDKINDTIVFLKKDNVLLAVKGMEFKSHKNKEWYDADSANRHFYEEHTCPTNYLNDVLMVIDTDEDDDDPHGIFEYVGFINKPEHLDFDDDEIDEIIRKHYQNKIKK